MQQIVNVCYSSKGYQIEPKNKFKNVTFLTQFDLLRKTVYLDLLSTMCI